MGKRLSQGEHPLWQNTMPVIETQALGLTVLSCGFPGQAIIDAVESVVREAGVRSGQRLAIL